jgi:Mor family transcriptional regulator
LPEICLELAELSDLETAKNICRAFAGCQVYFPLLVDKDAKLKARNKAIYEDRNDKGMSFRNLVEKYGISERSLRNAIASVTQSTVES